MLHVLDVQTFHFFKFCKMQKISKNSEILKNDGHFQISLKQFSNICKNVVLFYYGGGGKMRIFAKHLNFSKKFTKVSLVF